MLNKGFSINNDKGGPRKGGKGRNPNTRSEDLEDESFCAKDSQPMYSTNRKVESAEVPRGPRIKKGLQERELKIEFFIIEDQSTFKCLDEKSKILKVLDAGSTELRELYYELGSDGSLPDTYLKFKDLVWAWCLQRDVSTLRKYKDEQWSEFILRLNEISDEKAIRKRLLKEKIPNNIQLLLLTDNGSLADLIDRIRILERFEKENNQHNKTKGYKEWRSIEAPNKSKIQCYLCGNYGHKKMQCSELKEYDKRSFLMKKTQYNSENEEDTARINGSLYKVILDTGSSKNFININIIGQLGLEKIIKKLNKPEYYKMINGSDLQIMREIELKVEIKGKETRDFFKIVEKGYNGIVIGRELIGELDRDKKEILIKCMIKTIPGKVVSWSRPIRNNADRQEFLELVESLENQGIIEPSKSCWLNPVVLQRKKSGKLRFCIDFRRLNELVDLDGYEIPNIQEIMTKLRDYRWFSVIDLEDGFFQIDIEPQDREKTTFFTGYKLMQFRKMPQGYKNSPGVFQRAMTVILEGLISKICYVYIDDILVFGKTKQEHRENFEIVKARLEEYEMHENIEKRIFEQEKVTFLGYNISLNKIEPTIDRAQGITEYKRPECKKDLQRFLGKINYDRKFIKDLSMLAKPLYELTEKDKKFIWTDIHEKSFINIKSKWKENLSLIIPDMKGNFELETDACDTGLGAVLRQDSNPIAFISRNLKKEERNYGITEKEFLGVLWAIESLQYYLIGKKFTIVTDHKALETVRTKAEFGSARIQRWVERLDRFTFEIKYKPGEQLVQADALSRSTQPLELEPGESLSNIGKEILAIHVNNNHRKGIKRILREKGIEVSSKKLRNILEACDTCMRKDNAQKPSGKHIETNKPGEKIGIDIMDINGKELLILGIDYFTRKLWGKVVLKKTARNVKLLLMTIYEEIKFKKLISDNGKEFKNQIIKEWALENNIKQEFVAPYHHQGNGRIERANRTIREALKRVKGATRVKINKILTIYNKSEHRALGMSPIDAFKEENENKIIERQAIYGKEFKTKKLKRFEIGDTILIKNEDMKNKMDDVFNSKGTIQEILEHDTYEVLLEDDSKVIRHSSQLRKI